MNITLLDSLNYCLQEHEKSLNDIIWIGSQDFSIPIDNFCQLASTIPEYERDNDVAEDIIISGKDFWVEREIFENNGKWVYKVTPQKAKDEYTINALNFNHFSSEQFEMWEKIKRKRYRETHLEDDYPNSSYFKLREMLYKK